MKDDDLTNDDYDAMCEENDRRAYWRAMMTPYWERTCADENLIQRVNERENRENDDE